MTSRAAVFRCASYDPEAIFRHLGYCLTEASWGRSVVKAGDAVFVKPNLCLPHRPDEGITTHPVVLEQLVRLLLDLGARVTIGDNPIGKSDKGIIERIWDMSGIREVALRYGCKLSMLDAAGFETKEVERDGKRMEYLISREFIQADVAINVPKLKTHALTGMTGAIKNLYGIIPGRSKVKLHGFAPAVPDFAKVLCQVYSHRIPELTVMDGILGLEGDGPGARGVARPIGLLIVGNDGVLVDSLASSVIGFHPEDIATTVEAARRGLGVIQSNQVEWHGVADLDECVVPDYVKPSTMIRATDSEVIRKLFEIARFKVRIEPDACDACSKCRQNCPVGAIKRPERDTDKFVITPERCVQCLCCLEVCPSGAVTVLRNRFYDQLKTWTSSKRGQA